MPPCPGTSLPLADRPTDRSPPAFPPSLCLLLWHVLTSSLPPRKRSGEAVDLIKAAILSRPAAPRKSLSPEPVPQRYQIEGAYSSSPLGSGEPLHLPVDGSPGALTSRLDHLLASTPGGEEAAASASANASSSSSTQGGWSPADAMRQIRQKTVRPKEGAAPLPSPRPPFHRRTHA